MSPFVLLVAADLYGSKVNLELLFPAHPSVSELTRVTESTFAVESSLLRPDGKPMQPVKVARFQLYDDRSERWVELTNAAQLVVGAQVYAFQRETPFHTETQKPIPVARQPSKDPTTMTPSKAATPYTPMPQSVHRSPPRRPELETSPQRRYMDAVSPPRRVHVADAASSSKRRVVPEHATMEEKVRLVFDEIDVNSSRSIEPDEWKRALRVLGIEFSTATSSDLFSKADMNGDGSVTLSEFQQFCVGYPTLLDCLYYRTRDYWEDYAKKQEIKACSDVCEELKERERQTRAMALDAQRDVEVQEKKLEHSETELQGRGEREKELRVILLEAQRETERSQKDRGDKEQELAMGRERERQRQLALLEAQRDTERMEKRLASQDTELGKAQEKERQLQALLLEAQRETERQHKLVQNAQVDLAQSREREQQSNGQHLDAQREVQRLSDRVAQGEMDVASKLEKEREVEAMHLDAQRETSRAAHRRDEEERELFAQRDREQQRVLAQNDALRAVEEQDQKLKSLEAEYQQMQQRKALVEQQEKPLLEQEVRLREQRDSLEEKEHRLKSDAASFFDVNRGRRPGSPPASARVASPRRVESSPYRTVLSRQDSGGRQY
eukprot:PhM_4_TR14155/c1_g1_i1/m.51648